MSIYVIDDHPLIRDAVSMVLRRLRPAANIVELDRLSRLDAAVIKHGPPDLICLDLNLPDTNGCLGVIEVKRSYGAARLAIYSASPAEDMEAECRAHGADIYVDKATGAAQLAASLRALLASGAAGAKEADGASSAPPAPATPTSPGALTARQQQLVNLLDEGLGNREMASRLGISEETVKVHMWRLYRRLNVNSRTQALHFARTNGWLSAQQKLVAADAGT